MKTNELAENLTVQNEQNRDRKCIKNRLETKK